jgi:peptidyl-prolyl cis-trans isomerase SurA
MFNFRCASTVLLSASLVLVNGCHKGVQEGVVALVNGHPIFEADVDKSYNQQIANPQQPHPTSQDQTDALRLRILHELIDEEIIEQRAAKENLTATDSDVDAKLASMKAPYTEEQFQQQLKTANLTLDGLKHDLRRQLTIDKLLNKEIESPITITDADVTNYFNSHKQDFNLPADQFHLAQILVTDHADPQAGNLQNNKATSEQDALKKIQALKVRIDEGADFGMLAANFSEDPESAPNQGDRGFVSEEQIHAGSDPATYTALMKLKAGETTPILPILDANTHKPAGYVIYKLISREPKGQRDLSDPQVQQAIRQQLHDSRSQLLKAAYYEMIHDQAKVENFYAEKIFKSAAK